MRVLTDSKEIRAELKKLAASRLAVAYIGADWRDYVDARSLESVILSPTLGSNPHAIADLVREIGWNKVHFLDNLHAKIYLGQGAALLGSANLSQNALGDGNLFEAMVLVRGESALVKLDETFDAYLEKAKECYQQESKKQQRLNDLRDSWNRGVWAGVFKPAKAHTKISELSDDELRRIHVVWWFPGDMEYQVDNVAAETGCSDPEAIDRYFSDRFSFSEQDEMGEGDWLLCWRSTVKGLPHGSVRAYWMQVHRIIPEGFVSTHYPTLVGEVKQYKRGPVPFELDDALQATIREMLGSRRYPKLLADISDADIWSLNAAKESTMEFLKELRRTATD